MLIRQEHLLNGFDSDDFPPFPCPKCGATLISDAKAFRAFFSSDTAFLQENGAIDQDDGGGVFSAILKCAKEPCSEYVSVAGNFYLGETENPDGSPKLVWFLRPEFFTPTLPIFRLPDSVPKDVSDAITSSFRLFWADPPAAANALRTSLELLLDHKQIPRTETTSNGARRLSLHRRIESFEAQEPDIAKLLLATKWIGNEGSHSALGKDAVITGYKLVSYILDELFEQKTAKLTDQASRINRNKGHVS